jgi:hypothetical protein
MISGDIRGGAVARRGGGAVDGGGGGAVAKGGQFTRPMRAHCTEVENS